MAETPTIPRNAVADHMPTVVVKPDGTLDYTSDRINTVKLDNKVIKVLPGDDEKIVSLLEHKHLFANLEFADILLTNACNLSCSYCYEQHNRDYGRFTPASIRKIWDWLRDINDYFPKYIQFFGGEPLIHAKLILDFMRENKDELERMGDKMAVSITTNGLLLTKPFVDEFFSYPNVKMMISLDTIDAKVDHRGIPQLKIDHLLDMIEYVATKVKHPDNLAIRATITRAGSPFLKNLWEAVYSRGVKQLIFHPLILSLGEGYVEWPADEWEQFCGDIREIVTTHPDIEHFQVAEGVGAKTKTNCLVGSDEIAVDASGDFTGCYFFTNRKGDAAGKMLLGNIHDDALYIDRYNGFKANYEKMYDEHEECKTCNVKNLCYQCPAGNMATDGKLFRPDGMCKKFITLYSDLNEMMMENKFKRKITSMVEAHRVEGDKVLSRALVHLMHHFFEDERADVDEVVSAVDECFYQLNPLSRVNSEFLVRYFNHMVEYADRPDTVKTEKMTPRNIVQGALDHVGLYHAFDRPADVVTNMDKQDFTPTEIWKLYKSVCQQMGYPLNNSLINRHMDNKLMRITLVTAMHFIIMNTSETAKPKLS